METIKVCYSIHRNIGDALNPIIIEKVLGKKVEWADQFRCDTSGIGSGLWRFFIDNSILRSGIKNLCKRIMYPDPCQIWSAGFYITPKTTIKPLKNNMNLSSVRGNLSKNALEKIYGRELDITIGDAGLLASELIKYTTNKKFMLGIIPHYQEQNDAKFQFIKDGTPNSVIIDVLSEPLKILKTISQCGMYYFE
jgi:hypothetical protein